MTKLTVSLFLLYRTLLADDYDILSHGKECAEKLGMELPVINCLKGDIVPITVNGKELPNWKDYEKVKDCDKPTWLPMPDHCVPYSRQQVILQKDVEINVLCRRYQVRPADSPVFDDVGVIMRNKKTNQVCFFEILHHEGGFDGTNLPPPYQKGRSKEDNEKVKKLWFPPEKTATVYGGIGCTGCHSNTTWKHSPWIDQVKGKNQVLSGLFQPPMKVIGKPFIEAPSPPRITINEECYDQKFPPTRDEKPKIQAGRMASAGKCTECHFLGPRYVEYATLKDDPAQISKHGTRFPEGHYMPPAADWDEVPNENPPPATRPLKNREEYLSYYKRAIEAAIKCGEDSKMAVETLENGKKKSIPCCVSEEESRKISETKKSSPEHR